MNPVIKVLGYGLLTLTVVVVTWTLLQPTPPAIDKLGFLAAPKAGDHAHLIEGTLAAPSEEILRKDIALADSAMAGKGSMDAVSAFEMKSMEVMTPCGVEVVEVKGDPKDPIIHFRVLDGAKTGQDLWMNGVRLKP
jgi:hypothetical protein